MNKYIEEYKKCYNGSSFNKPIQKSMISHINTLSTNPIDINKTKNIFSNRKYKVTNPINVNLLYKSSYEYSPPKKNNSNEIRTKRSPQKIVHYELGLFPQITKNYLPEMININMHLHMKVKRI